MTSQRPNILLIGVDSLRADHMSCYGYPRLTTPHLDRLASEGVLFENTLSPHIPTTPGYASMLSGRDCFGTGVVALRHPGPLTDKVPTLAEILRAEGYATTGVGFADNAAARGFDNYLEYKGWGGWDDAPLRKAENLNEVTQPELDRLAAAGQPFLLVLRHTDCHTAYLPPAPFDRLFYQGDELDPANRSMDPVFAFKPFADYFKSCMPPGLTDKDWVIAQYDGALAYMDVYIQQLLLQLATLGIADDTIVVLNADHGETLYDHECWFDHHGLYDCNLHVPLIIRYPGRLPAGRRIVGHNQHKDLVPTLLELAGICADVELDGRSLLPLVDGRVHSYDSELYLTECTWMRKHGWRTPEWKLIVALEPDFHFKPDVELYDLTHDPGEDHNVAGDNPEVVDMLRERIEAFIARREKETGTTNPILNPGAWHRSYDGPFQSSQEAYDNLYIPNAEEARRLQAAASE